MGINQNRHLKYLSIFIVLLCSINCFSINKYHSKNIKFSFKQPVVSNLETDVYISIFDAENNLLNLNDVIDVYFDDNLYSVEVKKGEGVFSHYFNEHKTYVISYENLEYKKTVNPIPLWFSIIPPLIAIFFALIFKEVFTALIIGIFSGTLIIYLYQGLNFFYAFFAGLFSIVDKYVAQALFNKSHLSIIIFTMMIGGTVHIISVNGGMKGIINFLSKYAKSSKSGQLVTWFMGLCIFFDDYANTLVVGNTMRPLTDKLKVSREKLAYIVDSTAAPIAAVAFVTTWIGAELTYVQAAIDSLNIQAGAYEIFFASLRYSFYPFLAIIFVFLIIVMRREFGPMYKAEVQVKNNTNENYKIVNQENDEQSKRISTATPKAFNAIIPVFIIIFGTVAGLIYTGWQECVWNNNDLGLITKLSLIIGEADSYKALIWSSFSGLIVAILLSVLQKILSLQESVKSMLEGFKTMLTAILILTLAWSLAELISDLRTAYFITGIIQSSEISIVYIPAITFIVSALVAFSTGSSWGTMAIMYPLILPAVWIIGLDTGLPQNEALSLFAHVVSTVIAGSVLGDHCSPISDTTILSSLATSCNHIQHVRTQMPYALTVGVVAIVFGTIPASMGVSMLISMPVAILILILFIKFFGKKIP